MDSNIASQLPSTQPTSQFTAAGTTIDNPICLDDFVGATAENPIIFDDQLAPIPATQSKAAGATAANPALPHDEPATNQSKKVQITMPGGYRKRKYDWLLQAEAKQERDNKKATYQASLLNKNQREIQKKADKRRTAEPAAATRRATRPQAQEADMSSADDDDSFDIEAWGQAEATQQENARAASGSAPVLKGTISKHRDEDDEEDEDEDEAEAEGNGFDLEAWAEEELRKHETGGNQLLVESKDEELIIEL